MSVLLVIVLILALLAIGPLLGGVAIYFSFLWLLTPVFNAPALTFWQSVGLAIVVGIFGGLFNSTKVSINSK
jgi:hypothetical protein